jgi:fructosamine-3-kinase
MDVQLLAGRLRKAGLAVASITPAAGGAVALAGLATLEDGRTIFAKTIPGSSSDLFAFEAEGLRALTGLGGVTTPEVLLSSPGLLVLEAMRPRRTDAEFWAEAGRMLARMHVSAVGERFGWHRDGWLGRLRQENAWNGDGHEFFARHRLLRWLSEPLVEAAFDARERLALERLCTALPEIVPAQPPVLNHGDLWTENMVATASGAPVFIDPAVSYTWAESDLSMVWSANRPPVSDRFFAAYAEIAPLLDGWQQRMPVLHLREVLSVIAHDDDWGAVAAVREVIAPFSRS